MSEIPNNLKNQINTAAYFLSHRNHPYDTLCWMLAERELFIQFNFIRPQKEKIRKRAARIFFSKPPYDVLCWLIAEKDILFKSKMFKRSTKPTFYL